MNPDLELDKTEKLELNKIIAEKIMGLEDVEYTETPLRGRFLEYGPPMLAGVRAMVPNYSTDIAAAWEVVEKINRWHFQLERMGPIHPSVSPDGFEFICTMKVVWPGVSGEHIIAKSFVSAPHAICLAALEILKRKKMFIREQ